MAKISNKIIICAVLCGASLLSFGCGPSVETYPSLVDQGILSLSTTNPYLGANLFLARELERSAYLFNFFKNRGAPIAIEILKPSMHEPRILMFYPTHREVYAADAQMFQDANGTKRREWIVRGPFQIEREDVRTLARMETTSMNGEAVFSIWGKPYRFRFQNDTVPDSHSAGQVAPLTPELPIPTPTPKPKKKTPIITGPSVTVDKPIPTPTPTPGPFRPLSSDQQALQISKGFARRAENGDVLHTVRGANETTEQIARWYTGSSESVEEIAKINSLLPTQILAPGTIITVPLRFVKEFKAMP